MKSKLSRYILIILFLGCLVFPTIDKLLGISVYVKHYTENRPKAEKPKFNINLLETYPKNFESYYNDNFRLRSQIMKFYNKLCIYIFKKSPIPEEIIVGKSNWLYAAKDLAIYRGTDLFTETELKSICGELDYRKKYLKKRGCRFYMAVVPSKTRIYSEFMPDNIVPLNTLCYSEQLIQYLKKNSSVNIIDLYPLLKEKKQAHNVYLKADNHWNNIGAYYVSQAIINIMQKDFPNLPSLLYNDLYIYSYESIGYGMAFLLGMADEIKDTAYIITPIKGIKAKEGKKHPYKRPKNYNFALDYEYVKEQPDTSLPKILVIRDSFGEAFIESFSESFSKSVYILDNWEYKLNEDIVESEKPDIMLLLIYEPFLKNLTWIHPHK